MLVIEIHPGAEVRAISYTNKQGAPAQLHKQTAWAHLTSKDGSPAPYPSQCEILVPRNAQGQPAPYAPGRYALADSSFFLDKYQGLALSPRLVPLKG